MGIVFGRTGVAEPPFQLLASSATYEIRSYERYFIASVKMTQAESVNRSGGQSFPILARYIGVFGTPENVGSSAMAMTAPVLFTPEPKKLAMTAPVLTGGQSEDVMSFVLPFEFTHISQVPKPTDRRVIISEIGPKIIACNCFSGSTPTREVVQEKLSHLLTDLKARSFVDPRKELDDLIWQTAGYHPPFTIPFLRRNEVWIELDRNNPAIKELLLKKINEKEGEKAERGCV